MSGTFIRQPSPEDVVVGTPVELMVLSCRMGALRCHVLGTDHVITLRSSVQDKVPGEILTVQPTKVWANSRSAYLSGRVLATRVDVPSLGLAPLPLRQYDEWDPAREHWGDTDEPVPAWARPLIEGGKRRRFELEQVVPGVDPEDFDSDPIIEASELNAMGHRLEARDVLMKVLAQDLRCLDAFAHLGNFAFEHRPDFALRHYEMGVAIGALSLGTSFDGLLPWGMIDNRPFLRCLVGVGLCRWRLGHMDQAAAVFREMLWLNPTDNQGARFNLASVEAGHTWSED